MGLAHSGAVAEAALLAGSERRCIPNIAKFGIRCYFRFKDDVFIVFEDIGLLKLFFQDLKVGHPFEIECEAIHSDTMQFLDVEVRKTSSGFITKPA